MVFANRMQIYSLQLGNAMSQLMLVRHIARGEALTCQFCTISMQVFQRCVSTAVLNLRSADVHVTVDGHLEV